MVRNTASEIDDGGGAEVARSTQADAIERRAIRGVEPGLDMVVIGGVANIQLQPQGGAEPRQPQGFSREQLQIAHIIAEDLDPPSVGGRTSGLVPAEASACRAQGPGRIAPFVAIQ